MNQPLNATDAALWDIERDPTLRTTIVAVLHLAQPIDRDRLLNDLEAASRTIPKLRHRVVAGPAGLGTPHWELITDFDVEDRVDFIRSRGKVKDAQVDAIAADLASRELDRNGALWSCTYVGGTKGPAALVMRVHHSLTDGIGGVDLLNALLDADPEAPPRSLADTPTPKPAASAPLFFELAGSAKHLVDFQFGLAKDAARAAIHPVRSATGVWNGLQSTIRLLAPGASAMSPLMTERGPDRDVQRCELDLEQMHAAAARHGCTINQLLFAGVLEATAAYHREAHHDLDALRMLMPVSFRTGADPRGGNQWGPVKFTLPATVADPVERMLTMRTILERSQREPALEISQSLAGVVQLLPSAMSSGLVAGMMQGVDVVVTNIPGLTEERYLCGSRVERMFAFAPTAGAAFNVALVSHLGTAYIGILSDSAAVEAPDELGRLIATSLAEVVAAAEQAEPSPVAPQLPPSPERPKSPHRLSSLDTAFLRLETPETPMHLGGAIVMQGHTLRDPDGSIRINVARRHIEARLARVPHFRRTLSEIPLGLGRPLWVDDEDFDISRHVRLISVPQPGTTQDLLDLAAALHEMPLDRNHPLWELWFVDGLADGGVGVVEKVHHALIDGVGGVELAAAIFDRQPQAEPDLAVHIPPQRGPGPAARLLGSAIDQVADPFRMAKTTTRLVLSTPEKALEQARQVGAAARDFLRPSSLAPSASFNERIERRRILQRISVGLDDVHEAGRRVDASVNDVVLAAVAGALYRWLPRHGDIPFDLHAVVPVSIRHHDIDVEPGNRIGAVLATLPVLEPDSKRRIERVRDHMARFKAAHDGDGVALALGALDHLPAPSLRAVRLLALQRVANLVITNVPGPPESLYFLDAEVAEMVPILPLGPNLGLGIAIMSYRETLTVSLFADPALCADIDGLAQELRSEFETIVALD